jgi:diacylglycerol kinase (ATP)
MSTDMHGRHDRPLVERMGDGIRGVGEAWKRDQALRTHVFLSAAGIAVLLAVQPAVAWTLSVVVLVVGGLAAELVNSSVETALDKLHPDLDPAIGAAKDMASGAAAVINLAALALFVGAILTSII